MPEVLVKTKLPPFYQWCPKCVSENPSHERELSYICCFHFQIFSIYCDILFSLTKQIRSQILGGQLLVLKKQLFDFN